MIETFIPKATALKIEEQIEQNAVCVFAVSDALAGFGHFEDAFFDGREANFLHAGGEQVGVGEQSGEDPHGPGAVKLDFRIKCLKETLSSSTGNLEAAFIRWTRFFFAFDYTHTISGKAAIELNNNKLPFTIKRPDAADINTKWVIDYHMGFLTQTPCLHMYMAV